tara:strand:- start:2841 stop:3848 length:1008 start_codon:yes stop_codon:yes gene_type:complete
MAHPELKYARLEYSSLNFFSNENNINSFIRLNGKFESGSPNVTNLTSVSGYFDISYVKPGMKILSSGVLSGDATVLSVDVGNNSLVMDIDAEDDSDPNLLRIRPQKGVYFFESSSFGKEGIGEPDNQDDITGSLNTYYDSNELTWGIIGALSPTGSVSNTIQGSYGQYVITEVTDRQSSTFNFFASSSNLPVFTEGVGKQVSSGASQLMVSNIHNNLMTIASDSDLGASQGLGLAAYQTAVGSIFSTFNSGSGGDAFPFSGSAQITGSLSVTGSSIFSLNPNQTGDFFLIKSSSFNPLKVNSDGVVAFGKFINTLPSATEGGVAYSGSNFYVGLE